VRVEILEERSLWLRLFWGRSGTGSTGNSSGSSSLLSVVIVVIGRRVKAGQLSNEKGNVPFLVLALITIGVNGAASTRQEGIQVCIGSSVTVVTSSGSRSGILDIRSTTGTSAMMMVVGLGDQILPFVCC